MWGRVKAAGRMLFGYDAIKSNRYRRNKGYHPIRDEFIELNSYDRDELTGNLLDLKRNNPVVAAISRLKKTDIVGPGIHPQPATADEDFNKRIFEMWRDWSEYPEVTREMTMAEVQKELVDSCLFFGDMGVLNLRNGSIQLFDGSRIGNPGGVGSFNERSPEKNGVITNKYGRPVSYCVGQRVNGSLVDVQKISARHFNLYFKRMRPSQRRGVPTLAPVVNTLMDVAEFEEIEMISAKVSASLSAVIKRENAVSFELGNRAPEDEQDTEGRLETFEPGVFHYLEPGESVETISTSGRPNVDGIQWLQYAMRKVGACVGIPYEFLLADIGGASFSAAQGVNLQYQADVEEEQRLLKKFMGKLYRWKVAKWVADGDIEVPANVENPFDVRWQTPKFRWINRASQVEADIRYLQLGAISLDDVSGQFGESALVCMRRKATNIAQAKQVAEEFGIDDYREIFNQLETFANVNYADLLGIDKAAPRGAGRPTETETTE